MRSKDFRLVFLLLFSLFCLPLAPAGELVVVKDGRMLQARPNGGTWSEENDAVVGSAVGNYLEALAGLKGGDFKVEAELSLDTIDGTAASIAFGASHFGLDSGNEKFFIQGGPIEGTISFMDTSELITPGEPFVAKVERTGGKIRFSIDGKTVNDRDFPADLELDTIALRPWRNTMRVKNFVVSGELKDPPEPLNYIYESGKGGYDTYRIPAIVTSDDGTLLAFCEGRKNSASDTGDIDLLLRRSEDGGKTWGEPIVVWDDGGNTCGNPSPVVDMATGTIHLLSTWNLGTDHEGAIRAGKSEDTRRVFHLTSTDDGRTWSEPKEITSSVKKDDWTWYATGPCHGIQIRNGRYKDRLVIPCDHIELESQGYFSHVFYSDDHGRTWQLGGSTEEGTVNESSVAELPGGRLILNMRNYRHSDVPHRHRAQAYSDDGGETWSAVERNPYLPEPLCQGSIIDYPRKVGGSGKPLFFSNPSSTRDRVNMTIKTSFDGGKTWPLMKTVFPSHSAYSDLAILPSGPVALLFEGGYRHRYQGIAFDIFEPEELMEETNLLHTTVYERGVGGYYGFRIPVMGKAADGTLLAFAEGRKNNLGDAGNIDIVLRRSEDGGATWEPMQIVWNDGDNTAGNPVPVLDEDTGRVWLFITWNLGSDHETAVIRGTSEHPRIPYVTYSDDNGKTWAEPKKMDHLRKDDWRWYATGPVNGIQMTRGKYDGRLIIPANHSLVMSEGKSRGEVYHSHVIYSDDHGETWHIGEPQEAFTNESTVVELANGWLMQNMRSYHGEMNRAVAISTDGGETWSDVFLDDGLRSPVCQASILRYTWPDGGDRGRILFLSPGGPKRENLTLRMSYDEGRTWPVERVLYPGGAAYSNLVKIDDDMIGMLWEKDGYREIVWTVLNPRAFDIDTPVRPPQREE